MHGFLFYLQVSRNPKTVGFSLVLSADNVKGTGKKVLLRGGVRLRKLDLWPPSLYKSGGKFYTDHYTYSTTA